MITTVVGGQFGSEGKGAVVGNIARTMLGSVDLCVRVGGPNAGHTVYDERGVRWALRQVPAAAPVSNCRLIIGPGSEIDPQVLLDEVEALDRAGYEVAQRLWIHPAATVITDRHKGIERESGLIGRIGSTGKGIGAARADRIMRQADLIGMWDFRYTHISRAPQLLEWTEYPWGQHVPESAVVLVEGTQGYGLGLHTAFYPQVTSSNCRAVDMLAMAGLPTLGEEHVVVLVVRPNPIRVAGESGPLWGETSWDALGLSPEYTTVTGKVRRVGKWDPGLVREAVAANGGRRVVRLALTMLDHLFPACRGVRTWAKLCEVDGVRHYIGAIEQEVGASVLMVGTGPDTMVGM